MNISNFIKKNSCNMLTGFAGVGVIVSCALTVKSTIDAVRKYDAISDKESKTSLDKAKIVAPYCIKPAISVGLTLSCIFGANHLSNKERASLMGAYVMLESSFHKYKNKVKEIYGDENKILSALAKDEVKKAKITDYKRDKILVYDEFSEQLFETTFEDLEWTAERLTTDMITQGKVSLNQMYDYLNLPQTDQGNWHGWSTKYGEYSGEYTTIQFEYEKTEIEGGLECYLLKYPFASIHYDQY